MRERFARLSTAAKLFLILTLVLLPFGLALASLGESGIRSANAAIAGQSNDRARMTTRAVESLIARNALALRVAANAALAQSTGDPCERMRKSLAIVPAVAQNFELEAADGTTICATGTIGEHGDLGLVAPGAILVRLSPASDSVAIRTGVVGGMATGVVSIDEIRDGARHSGGSPAFFALQDQMRRLTVIEGQQRASGLAVSEWAIGNGDLVAWVGIAQEPIAARDRLILLLPLLMWFAAAIIAWLIVSRLLIAPLKKLESAISDYQPGESNSDLPENLGPALEIRSLRDAFTRAIDRVEVSEGESADALEGQRRLVREVHHRVKNNLQVIASLLNIHGRIADSPDVRAAYAAISRRVGALSVVHRNHFAEMEENRGIALRPLVTELAAELRVSAPDQARNLTLELELDPVNTTQDVAVAIAFLITEIVEFAMLDCPEEPIEVTLRRSSELTARLTLSSKVLTAEASDSPSRQQFERIVAGLAKQLRSPLERKLGRYSVEFPVFPAN
ncbi:MAG: sensor histidine kinase [Sphingomicrobium sp.]